MSKTSILTFTALIVFSSRAYASDPAPLFVMFIALPLIIVGLLIAVLGVFKPKIGIVMGGLLLIGQFVVMSWASDVGYMDSAGGWVFVSLVANLTALVVAAVKLSKANTSATDT